MRDQIYVSDEHIQPWRARLRRTVSGRGGPSAVARLADIPLQTLKNHLSGRTKKAPLGDLQRIATACGVEFEWLAALERTGESVPKRVGRFSEPDVQPYEGPPLEVTQKPAMGYGRWTVRTRALDLVGILPGDIVEFAIGGKPVEGQVVVAQVDDDTGGAATVLRLYMPPYLTVHTTDSAIDRRPLTLGDTVRVMGAFARLWRIAGTPPAGV